MHHEQEQQNGCNTVFPRDIDCLRNISVNTLHKGDDDDDDDDDYNNKNNNNKTYVRLKKLSSKQSFHEPK